MGNLLLDIHDEIIVDNFAGGGGASTGIERALGRRVDVAINHDPQAIAMHTANHPETEHHCESVWDVDPRTVKPGRPIGLLWLSPDCKHFSKAKGGTPVDKNIRALAWVALRWVAIRKPRIIMLENVEEFVTWGPLTEGQDGKLYPCPKRRGREFNAFTNALRRHGYQVEWRELRACNFGAPTIRKRLFLIARRDGLPIRWPEPTHYDPKRHPGKKKLRNGAGQVMQPWRTAAECIDWSIPCPSIFERTRPLADATCKRIAKGLMRYVVNSAEPFIVPVSHSGDFRVHDINEPLRTVTGSSRSTHALVAPVLAVNTTGHPGGAVDAPAHTITTGGHHALVTAFLAKHYGGVVGSDMNNPIGTITSVDHHSLVAASMVHMGHGEQCSTGAKRWSHGVRDIEQPLNTITAQGAAAGLVTSNLLKLRGDNVGQATDEPLRTISAGGTHFAEVRAFLVKYYSEGGQDQDLRDPMHTIPTRDRLGLVTVAGEDYAIADIGLRMLAPRELFRAHGFPEDYIIEWGMGPDGQRIPLTKTAQVRMCGNSVSPPMAAALVRANAADMAIAQERTA